MKLQIKIILDEMLSFGNRSKLKVLKKAGDTLEVNDFSSTVFFILQWNRTISKGLLDLDKYFIDRYIFNKELSDTIYKKNKRFFDLCPEISEIFTLFPDKIEFNSKLNDYEKKEIRDYIAERFRPPLLTTIKKPKNNS
ncbi:hypothetical protein EZY14_001165 [Kordia sp. TARA_039_SRF]|nr:hypothetical protein EZY14_001165 [Kordia sp. TARA_039_SRF]